MVERARIVLAASEGLTTEQIAGRVGCSERTVKKRRPRYARDGIEGVARRAAVRGAVDHGPVTRALLIAKASTRPKPTEEGARRERWTYEELGWRGRDIGLPAHVILQRAEIKPHLSEYWIMSDFSRPEFEERCGELAPPFG